MSNREDYFNYIGEVLGIKSILLEDGASATRPIPLLVVVDQLNSYSAEEWELLEKMISALKISKEKIKIIDASTQSVPRSDRLLILADDPKPSEGSNVSTYSPRILRLRPEFKKKAWTEMQMLVGAV